MRTAIGTALSYLWKVPVCAAAYVVGTMAGAALVQALGLELPAMPEGADEATMAAGLLLGSLVVVLGLAPVARSLCGRFGTRWTMLGAFAFVTLGVNTAIEAHVFTTMRGTGAMAALVLLPCLMCAGLVALLFRAEDGEGRLCEDLRRFFSGRRDASWAWRLGLAVLAFPAVYFLFGTPVGLIVADYYREGAFGLRMPGWGTIIPVQMVRSVLFLLVSLPILVAWSGPRGRLILALGFAHFALVGLFGLIQSFWLPLFMRGLHGIEILADSMLYAWALVTLLQRSAAVEEGPVGGGGRAAARPS